jgi:hypothetical protein
MDLAEAHITCHFPTQDFQWLPTLHLKIDILLAGVYALLNEQDPHLLLWSILHPPPYTDPLPVQAELFANPAI